MASQIVLPKSQSKRGFAFEHLILNYFKKTGIYEIIEWSNWVHGVSGKWLQVDGIVKDGNKKYVLEAKFLERPISIRTTGVMKKLHYLDDLRCDGIIYASLNGFEKDMFELQNTTEKEIKLISWNDVKSDVLGLVKHKPYHYSSSFLDSFDLSNKVVKSEYGVEVNVGEKIIIEPYEPFQEFVVINTEIEVWLRRLPMLEKYREEIIRGSFWYLEGRIRIKPYSQNNFLSLKEAWMIEDTFSGYASCKYDTIKSAIQLIQGKRKIDVKELTFLFNKKGHNIGLSGVRNILENLRLLGLMNKQRIGQNVFYSFTNIGKAFANNSNPADKTFREVLNKWPPYIYFKKAISLVGEPKRSNIGKFINFFKTQYRPYEPYAKSLYNENKVMGLILWYKKFG